MDNETLQRARKLSAQIKVYSRVLEAMPNELTYSSLYDLIIDGGAPIRDCLHPQALEALRESILAILIKTLHDDEKELREL